MSIYIRNDLEDRLKILETKNASLKKYTMNTIKWYMKLIISQLTVIQELEEKDPNYPI